MEKSCKTCHWYANIDDSSCESCIHHGHWEPIRDFLEKNMSTDIYTIVELDKGLIAKIYKNGPYTVTVTSNGDGPDYTVVLSREELHDFALGILRTLDKEKE